MKKSLTALVALSTTFAFASVTAVLFFDADKLAKDIYKNYVGTVTIVKLASVQLADDALIFETTPIESDFKIELEGVKTGAAKSFTLRGIKTDISVHEINKLAVEKKNTVKTELTALKLKDGNVVFYADKKVGNSDYTELDCKGCEDVWTGSNLEYTVSSPRDIIAGQASGRRSGDSCSGVATGRRAKVIMDRDTGRSKSSARFGKCKATDSGDFKLVNDSDLIANSIEYYLEQPEKEFVIVYEKVDMDEMEGLLKIRSAKLIVPVAMDKGIRLHQIDIAIKEQGVKLAIDGSTVTVTLNVSEAKPQAPREK